MRSFAITCAAIMIASGLVGQSSEEAASGLSFGAGIAAGTARVTCPLCSGDAGIAPSIHARVTGSFTPSIGWGVEGNAWRETDLDAGVRDAAYSLGLAVYWYLSPVAPRWYVKGGLGPMWYRVEDADVDEGDTPSPSLTSTAAAGQFGIGVELPAGRFRITPFMHYAGTVYGSLFRGDTRVSHAQVSFAQLGIGLAWR